MNVHTKPFYMHENQCTQILNLTNPDITHKPVSTIKNLSEWEIALLKYIKD